MRSSLFLSSLITLSAAATSGALAQNLVQNGNFNQTSYVFNNQFGTAWTQTTMQGVTGWTGNGGYDLYFFSGTATTDSANTQYDSGYNTGSEKLDGTATFTGSSPNGDNFVALDGDPSVGGGGGLSQMINGLTVGTKYTLSFVWAASQLQSKTGQTTEDLQVSLGGQIFATTPTVTNPSNSFTGWFTQAYTFTATSTQELLSFLSQGSPSGEPPIALLTDVSVTKVPEPGTLTVLGAGLAGLMAVRRRCKGHRRSP
ncbi:DUF642 domain-containing protein [Acidisphaera sp. S103]|uniref:DUF642 domain-containing protein n=1 Tax=Acidisphaera sp. S103 TaxID=1747223 RepID=UPI00131DD328|nr:DUF642 domain-containing protein [Acidisphaera sp. S103]